jgi:hypothetical protein
MNGISPLILATSILAVGSVGFAAGLVVTQPAPRQADDRPIVDPDAWDTPAPQPVVKQVSYTPPAAATDCSPWNVSEEAMEATLMEMRQRGWRPPKDVEQAMSDVNEADLPSSWYSAEAASPTPAITVDTDSATIAIVSDAESRKLWRDAEQGSQLPPAQPAISVNPS